MRKYLKRDITKEWLLKNDFRYNRHFSTKDDTVYTNRFTVLVVENKKKPSLECEMLCYFPEGIIYVNVYHAGTRDKYAPFYNSEYGNWDKSLFAIRDKIKLRMERIGAEAVEWDDNN